MFATIDAAPGHLYVKVGQFASRLGLSRKTTICSCAEDIISVSNKRDVGVEVGGSAGKMFYNAAVFNGGNFTVFNGVGAVGSDAIITRVGPQP